MTKLLVSVRSAAEAVVAVDAGADLIDVKEPRLGSLGAATPLVIAEVVRAVAGRRPASAALGELAADSELSSALVPDGIQFAKIGLAGCATRVTWVAEWSRWIKALPRGVAAVAVIYADWPTAAAPPPRDVLRNAERLGCRALLIDTFDKSGPGLCESWSAAQLAECVAEARARGLTVVLAGRVEPGQVAALLLHEPDFIAVRGCVCRPDRTGAISGDLLRNVVQSLY